MMPLPPEYSIEQLREILRAAEQLEENFAWQEYVKYLRAQEQNRMQHIVQGPDVVSLDKVDYIRGEIMGLRLAQGFMELMRASLGDELALKEKEDGQRKPERASDSEPEFEFGDADIFGNDTGRTVAAQLDALARASRRTDPGKPGD